MEKWFSEEKRNENSKMLKKSFFLLLFEALSQKFWWRVSTEMLCRFNLNLWRMGRGLRMRTAHRVSTINSQEQQLLAADFKFGLSRIRTSMR